MEDQQTRILDDLRDVVTGDILVDDLARAAYSTDASILEVRPMAIVAPRTTEELAGVVRYASEQGIKIQPRGAGTGLAGESLGPDLMVDTSRYLTKILETGRQTVRVQPGVRWVDLERHLAGQGRMFAPDPVSGDRCTIGGMLATDAAGPHSLRYGTTRHHVRSLRVVLASGELVEVGQEPLTPASPTSNGPVARIAQEVGHVLRACAEDIQVEQPAQFQKHGGYALRGVLGEKTVDLARMLVGSEGTLAIFAEAELATLPIPTHRALLLASFATLELAAKAVLESLEDQPSACELLDRRLLALVRAGHPVYRQWIPEDAEALLLIEQQDMNDENVTRRVRLTAGRLEKLAQETVEIHSEPEMSLCWEIRNRATPGLGRSGKNVQPIALVENAAVPPPKLPEFLKRVQDIMKRHGVTASYAAHAGVGLLHTRPLLDIYHPADRSKLEKIAADVLEAVLECGGTNNGEHGVGLLRSCYLPRQYPKLYPAFQKIKAIFDPHNQFNPGKIVGAEPDFPIVHLRSSCLRSEMVSHQSTSDSSEEEGDRNTISLQLLWPERSMAETANRCNGCGSCQTSDPSVRMCPTFKAFGSELASPRSKANLMRQLVSGELDLRHLPTDDFRSVADYCIDCKLCRLECPSSVDISKLMIEAKAANVAEHGLSGANWFLSGLEGWSRWASANAVLANALLANRGFRWLTEKLMGLSQHRQIPRFHHQTFLHRAARNGWTRKPRTGEPKPKVAILADLFVNHNDPQLGECVVRVLDHHRRKVYVPPSQGASGMGPLRYGDLETARASLESNLKELADLAREGYDIICPEPSAALMLRNEARNLIDDPDLDLIARRTYEFSEYMAILAERGELRLDLTSIPLTVAYHEPCHQRALAPRASAVDLMRRIPDLHLVPMDLGCSGMAGTFGIGAETFETSMTIGSAMLDRLRREDIYMGVTQCSACRMQMEQGAGKRTLHPAKWLAVSYGLVKRPEKLFVRPGNGLVGG